MTTKDGLRTRRPNVERAENVRVPVQVLDMARGDSSCTVSDVLVDASPRQGILVEVAAARAVRHRALALVVYYRAKILHLDLRLHQPLRVL